MTATFEQRALAEPVEFRAEGTKIVASGVAMRYRSLSKPIGGHFREQFLPGAFTKTLKEQDVRSHNEHGGPYLARMANGTLRTFDSSTELAYEIDLPDTSAGRDAAALLERGDIRGSSVGFRAIVPSVKWTVGDDGMALRTVGEAHLALIDLTVSPAYESTSAAVAMRSLAEELHTTVDDLLTLDVRTLAEKIASPEGEDERSDDEGRETPTFVRPRFAAQYL